MIALRGLHPDLRPAAEWLVREAQAVGAPITITSVQRSFAAQAQLRARFDWCVGAGHYPYRPGVSPEGCRWPANRPGESAHQPHKLRGRPFAAAGALAWDSHVPPEWMPWWAAVRRWAGWHVPEGDIIHAEVPGWRELRA